VPCPRAARSRACVCACRAQVLGHLVDAMRSCDDLGGRMMAAVLCRRMVSVAEEKWMTAIDGRTREMGARPPRAAPRARARAWACVF
jgi:hypothetical protein